VEAYLDYNATTPIDPAVLVAMRPLLEETFANPSSFHRKGQLARNAVEAARELVADALHVEPGDIIFTSGGTEADNLALEGVMAERGKERPGLVVSAVEHQAVLHCARHLETRGFEVTYVPVDKDGRVDLEAIKKAVTERTALVSLMHANNETGTVQPIADAARLAHAKGALFHTDAVQSFCKLELDPEQDGLDLISISSHKICGPKGAGALYAKKGVRLRAMLHGGHQERNVRPGTENVPAIAGFGAAARLAMKLRAEETARVRSLRDRLERGLLGLVSGSRANGAGAERLPGTASISFEGLDGETLLVNLDLEGIYASTGSACTAGSVEPSHVLLALGLPERLARATVRFSVGRFTTLQEIDHALSEIPPIVERLRLGATTRKP